MPTKVMTPVRWFYAVLSFCLMLSTLRAADMKPEEVLAKHLAAIGTPEARAAIKDRIVQGKAHFRYVVGAGGELDGTGGLVSEGNKSTFVIKFPGDYRGEQFITNGDKTAVAATLANHHRSAFAEFVRSQDYILKDGVLGGELSTNWALLNLDKTQAKLDYSGIKKFDGHPAHDLRYRFKKGNDMNVHIFLDPDTFQHIGTSYTISLSSGLGGQGPMSPAEATGLSTPQQSPGADVTQSSKQREIRYTIEEFFSDFKTGDGVTLPTKYVIRYTQELQSGSTTILEYTFTVDGVSHNAQLDPRNFEIK